MSSISSPKFPKLSVLDLVPVQQGSTPGDALRASLVMLLSLGAAWIVAAIADALPRGLARRAPPQPARMTAPSVPT